MNDGEVGPIDVNDVSSVAYWCGEFAVTEEQFRRGVDAVGAMPAALEFYFSTGSPPRTATAEQRAAFATRKDERLRVRHANERDAE